MAEARDAIDAIGHPAPHRDRVRLTALAFGLIAGPLAWAAQLFVNYAVASRVCFSGAQPQAAAAIGSGSAWLTLLIVELIAMAMRSPPQSLPMQAGGRHGMKPRARRGICSRLAKAGRAFSLYGV